MTTTPRRRSWLTSSVALATALAAAGLGVGATSAPVLADPLPAQCTEAAGTVTCTYLKSGGDQVLDLPNGVTAVELRVVGQAGFDAPGAGGDGGAGAVVTGQASIDGSTQDVVVDFREDGGVGVDGGGAGGDSTVVKFTRPRSLPETVAWAAGGGGGGAAGEDCWFQEINCAEPAPMPGGEGGAAGAAGASGTGHHSSYAHGGEGGGPGTSTSGGAGGDGGDGYWVGEPGQAGSFGAGGAGGAGGGGGGGGRYGGGGGGDGGANIIVIAPSGGGGGGSSLAPTGGTTSVADKAESARVVLSYALPVVEVDPTVFSFSDTRVGWVESQEITITNTSSGPARVNLDDMTLSGPDADDFLAGVYSCSSGSTSEPIEPGESCTVGVGFRPSSPGPKTALLTVHTDATNGPHVVSLNGTGYVTGKLEIRGPGTSYAEGHGNRQTLTIGTSATAQATFYLKVINVSSAPNTYEIGAESLGAAANVRLTLPGSNVALERDVYTRNWRTAVIPAGGSKTYLLRVDPVATRQVTARHALTLTEFNSPGLFPLDHATVETNIQAPTKGTDGFGLYAKAYGGFVGGDVDGQTATQVPFGTGQTKSYTIKLRNDGSQAKPMVVTMDTYANACWSIKVKKGIADITTAIGDGGYTTPVMKPGTYLNLAVSVKRVAAGCGAAEWEFATWDDGDKVHHSTILANAIAGTE